jgi:hypothetical protein
MKRGALWIVFVALCALGNAACGGSSHRTQPIISVVISTFPTTMVTNTTSSVVATVSNDSANAGVTWSCTPALSCGAPSFVPLQTASGAASVFTAPPTIPVGGQLTITATSMTDPTKSNSQTITITASSVATNNFVFYASGQENDIADDAYSIAGVVAIAQTASADGSFAVIGGEQDFNDGDINTSPQPSGDFITGGSLVFTNTAGQATLTLITNNPFVGVSGTETFALAFANANHALIVQFDGAATSSGSYDAQLGANTAPVSTSFSFVVNGKGGGGEPIVVGGVFALDASSNATGTVDVNDGGVPVLNTSFTGVLATTDSFGRGAFTGNSGIGVSVNYYVVGPEVLRIVNVDETDTGVGSAYGQGPAGSTPSFSPASIGPSVFFVAGNALQNYAAVGQLTTDLTSTFSGVGDENESVLDGNAPIPAGGFSGTYTLASTGYGSFTFVDGLGSIAAFGAYAVDPTLNILDPNNPLSAGQAGGALIAEMDMNLVGAGVLIPQTDSALGDFTGAFAFGAQGVGTALSTFTPPPPDIIINEFDFVGEGAIAAGALNGTGIVSDPFGALTTNLVESPNASFAAAFTADGGNPGRSTATLAVTASNTPPDFSEVDLTVTAYQANAGQAFWIDMDAPNATDAADVFVGSIELNTGVPAAAAKKRAQARTNNQKH